VRILDPYLLVSKPINLSPPRLQAYQRSKIHILLRRCLIWYIFSELQRAGGVEKGGRFRLVGLHFHTIDCHHVIACYNSFQGVSRWFSPLKIKSCPEVGVCLEKFLSGLADLNAPTSTISPLLETDS